MQRGLVGEIIKRFEQKGFKLVGLRMLNVDRGLAERHYADLSAKPFFGALVDYIVSGPVVAMVSRSCPCTHVVQDSMTHERSFAGQNSAGGLIGGASKAA